MATYLLVREQTEIRAALDGINGCRLALKELQGTLHDNGPGGRGVPGSGNALAIASAAAVVAMASSLVFGRAAIRNLHCDADSIISATYAGTLTHAFQLRLAALVSEEIGPAMPWFDMRVTRVHVRMDLILGYIRMLLEIMALLSIALEEANRRTSGAECRSRDEVLAFVHVVSEYVAEMAHCVDKVLVPMHSVNEDIREMRAAINVAKIGAGAAEEGVWQGDDEPLRKPLLLLAETSRFARIAESGLGNLWRKIAELSSGLSEGAIRTKALQG